MSDYTPTTDEIRNAFVQTNVWLPATPFYKYGEVFDRWFASEIEKAERRSRTDFADELTRKGVYSFDIHSIRRYAGE